MKSPTNNYVEGLKFDKRLLEINFKSGLLSKDEYEKFLSQLPDRANNATNMTLEDEDDFDSPKVPKEPRNLNDVNTSAASNTPGWNDNPFNSTY